MDSKKQSLAKAENTKGIAYAQLDKAHHVLRVRRWIGTLKKQSWVKKIHE
jgi:hypothetical protein